MSSILTLDPVNPDDSTAEKVITAITSGKTIAFPTETFYALGASAYNEAALQKVFTIKGREYTLPLPIIIEGEDMLRAVASEVPEKAHLLIQAFWPGGLTLIFNASPKIPALLTAHTGTVAVRQSSHPLARLLVAGARCPITATSANLSGEKSCSSAPEVEKSLGTAVDLIIDGGQTEGLLPSTIVDLTVSPSRIVREGIIPSEHLQSFLG
jgi:L-threonylcarbamoyladenylate synthase